MAKRTRRKRSAAFKAKVVLAAPVGNKILAELTLSSLKYIRTRSPNGKGDSANKLPMFLKAARLPNQPLM